MNRVGIVLNTLRYFWLFLFIQVLCDLLFLEAEYYIHCILKTPMGRLTSLAVSISLT